MKCRRRAATRCRTKPGSVTRTATNGRCLSCCRTTYRRKLRARRIGPAAHRRLWTAREESKMLRRLAAEFTGAAMLRCAVVGSAIMAERLAGGNGAVALLANTLATGAALFALILMFAPLS